MKLTAFLSCLFVVLFPLHGYAQSGLESEDCPWLCSSEGMLAWRGDPGLRDRVRLVRLHQYETVRDENGELVKRDAERPLYSAEFTLGADGKLLQNVSTRNHASARVMKYDINTTLFFHDGARGERDASSGLAPFHYVAREDAAGRVIAEDLYRGEDYIRTENLYTYDESGRLKTQQNSLNQLVTFAYDEAGHLVREDWAMVDAPEKPFCTNTTAYDAAGRVTRFREVNTSERFPERNTIFEKAWTYDASGRLLKARHIMIAPQSELLSEEIHEYDAAGKVTKRILRGETATVINRYTHDAEGRVIEISRHVQEQNGWKYDERIRFSLDERGNWLRAVMESGRRPCIIERTLEYY